MTAASLLFDLDGTLADTAGDLCETTNVILTRHGRERVSEVRIRNLVGGGARLLLQRGFAETGAEATEVQLDQMFQEFIEYYTAHIADHSKLWPGIEPLLTRLADEDVMLAVCTNKAEGLARQLLGELRIDHYFPVVIGGDTLSVKKPDPQHLLEAIRLLGGEHASAIMVGDSEADIDAAINAKIPSICVSFGYCRQPVKELGANIIIDHFDKFPAALAQLLPEHFGSWR